MNVLIINFEMDRLSKTMAWSQHVVDTLAKSCRSIVVMTNHVGEYDPPPNVRVEVLPKKVLGIPLKYGGALLLNFKVLRIARANGINACFIHMAQQWAFLFYPSFKILRIPTLLWYAHGSVSYHLLLAHACVNRVVTSTPEGCRIPSSKKIHVVGQGVNTEIFAIPEFAASRDVLLYTGRVTRRKRIHLLIDVLSAVRKSRPGSPVRLKIVGSMITLEDIKYDIELRAKVWAEGLEGAVEFAGFVPQEYHYRLYRDAFLHINVSKTGSMDKTVLESLACGCPVLTSNEAFRTMFKDHPEFVIDDETPERIAARVLDFHTDGARNSPMELRDMVQGSHDFESFAGKILGHLKEIA